MNLNIDFQFALDWGHCEDIHQASDRLSQITNLLNRVLSIRQHTKKQILIECSIWKGENMAKLSWENKMVLLSELTDSSELMELWQDSDSVYRQLRLKQEAILEDLLGLKKIADITPR